MEHLYSFVDIAGDWKCKIGPLENVIIKIAMKTRECAEFIQGYASRNLTGALLSVLVSNEWRYLIIGEGRIAHQTISDTGATISSLLAALLELESELRQIVMFHTAGITNETHDNIDRLRKRVISPQSVPTNVNMSTSQSLRTAQTCKHGCFDSTAVSRWNPS
jgi:hypothetical protein